MSNRGSQGFTLIELLVVVGIIAILASLVFYGLGLAVEAARCSQCASNLGQLGMAMTMYADDHNDRLALGHEWVVFHSSRYNDINHVRQGTLYRYLQEDSVYVCPTFRRICSQQDPPAARSYSINSHVKNFASMVGGVDKLSDVYHPSKMFLFSEENDWAVPGYSIAGYDDPYLAADPPPRNAIASFHRTVWRNRNEGWGNCVFFDGHAARHRIWETMDIFYNVP